jgi:hypothetical protein
VTSSSKITLSYAPASPNTSGTLTVKSSTTVEAEITFAGAYAAVRLWRLDPLLDHLVGASG